MFTSKVWTVYKYVRYLGYQGPESCNWVLFGESEVREVAEYHLGRLVRKFPEERFKMVQEFRR